MPHAVDHEIDMRDWHWHRAIIDAFDTLVCGDDDVIKVVGPAPMGGEFVEIVIDEAPLRDKMLAFIAQHSAAVAADLRHHRDAGLFLAALHVRAAAARITANMTAFHDAPEDPARVIAASARGDEIGTTERELAAMQRDLASMLQQKSHLAALGLAVSKIKPRSAQPAHLGAAVLGAAGDRDRSARPAFRAQADERARARHRVLPVDLVLWPRAGGAARPAGDRARAG